MSYYTLFLPKSKSKLEFLSQEFSWARLEPKAGLFSLLKSFGEESQDRFGFLWHKGVAWEEEIFKVSKY